MEETIVKNKMTFKRILRGMFQWQVLLVASAFLAFFVFITYIGCNICATYVFEDLQSPIYRSFEATMLTFFLIGSACSLSVAIFSAFMVDHPTLFKDIANKLKKNKQGEGQLSKCTGSPKSTAKSPVEQDCQPGAGQCVKNTDGTKKDQM